MRSSLGRRRALCRCGLPGVHTKNAKSFVDLTFAVISWWRNRRGKEEYVTGRSVVFC